MKKLKEAMKKIVLAIWDFISDKNNSGDEKRVLGIITVAIALWYGVQPTANPLIFAEYITFGSGLLGIASMADKVPLAKGEA